MIYINNAEWEEIFLQLSVFNRTGRKIFVFKKIRKDISEHVQFLFTIIKDFFEPQNHPQLFLLEQVVHCYHALYNIAMTVFL